ncbi:MAG TPA: hypothetical protein VNZ61_26040 [Roseomonas sp.]|nr:hypothetical protein [Roseomonas sp.]
MLALTLVVLGTAPVLAQRLRENRDVPWFQAHPQILDEMLRRCQRDARLAASWECQNAEAAGALRMGQPLPKVSPRDAQGRQAPPADDSGLPEPDYNPRTNPFGFQSLKRACREKGPGSSMFLPYCHQLDRYPEERDRGR